MEAGRDSTTRRTGKGTSRKAASSRRSEIVQQMRDIEAQMGRMIREMGQKVRQLEYLTKFSSILNSTLDTAVVRERALEATCELLRCETASLLLVDRKTGELYWETALGESGKKLERTVRLPINDRSIAGYVAMTGETLIINDVEKDPRHNKAAKKKTGFQTRNMMCIPLQARGRIVGVLQALNKLPSTERKAQGAEASRFLGQDMELFQSLGNQVSIAVENSLLYEEVKVNFYDTVEALAEAIEKKDRYTGGHTKRVVYYSMCIAKYMDLNPEEMERLRMGAVLHDVGKIGIEDKILKKPAALDEYEWPVMKTHPELGYQIMKRVSSLRDVIGAMRFHHERWDGKGYPLGLKGEEIPLIARVVAVSDTYDAMVSTRPYRKGMDPKIAYDEIVKNRAVQFCPRVVDAFKEAFKHEKMGKGSGGFNAQEDPDLASNAHPVKTGTST